MKSIRKNRLSITNKFIVFFLIVATVAMLAITAMYFTHTGLFNNQSTTDNSQNTQTPDNNSTDTPPIGTGKTPVDNQPTNNKTTPSITVGASITYVQQTSTSLRIGTLVESVTSSGSCTVVLTKGDQTVTHTVGIQPMASSSTCKGFDIPIIELPSGTWAINIDIKLSSQEAHLKDSVTIN